MVRNRSRLSLMALAIVMALVLSSCWQIRRVGVNRWEITVAETATVTLDLAKDVADQDVVGYPFVIVGFTSTLRNAGKKWDTLGNFGGPETGVKDQSLKVSLVNDEGFCSIGGALISDVKTGYSNVVVFRMSDEIDMGTVGANTILRFKHTLGAANGVAVPDEGNFIYITGVWSDDGDLTAEPGETVCQSTYSGTLALRAP